MSDLVLLVEDDVGLARILKDGLVLDGFSVKVKHTAEDALKQVRQAPPDLLILDVGLEGLSGFQLLELLRRDPATAGIPAIFLTALHTEKDKLKGLALGADDYITKPFSEKELIARARAVLRRTRGSTGAADVLAGGGIRVDLPRREVWAHGAAVNLSKMEFDLLVYMLGRRGVVHSYNALMENVWGEDRVVSRHTITVTASRLREKLGKAGDSIATIKDIGLKFTEER